MLATTDHLNDCQEPCFVVAYIAILYLKTKKDQVIRAYNDSKSPLILLRWSHRLHLKQWDRADQLHITVKEGFNYSVFTLLQDILKQESSLCLQRLE